MAEKIVDAEIGDVYRKTKAILVHSKCRLTSEEDLRSISVIQGSLWGTSPGTAQKKIKFLFTQDASGTCVKAHSALTSGYVNLTLAGCILSVALMAVCVWIGLDLQGYILTGNEGVWGWLAQTQGVIDLDKATVFIRFMWILSAFLASTLALEAFIIWNVRAKIDVFAEKKIQDLTKSE